MNKNIIFSDIAILSLKNIEIYIQKDSIKYAKIVRKEIIKEIKILNKFPKKGRVIPEDKDEKFREILVGNFRIMYKIKKENDLLIVDIIHTSMKITSKNLKF